jgi:hypothetical protein
VAYPESLRDALPRSEGYPLGRRALDAALSAEGVASLDLVYFLRAGILDWKRGDAIVVRVDFRAQTNDLRERVELRVHAVPTDRKAEVQAKVMTALPRIAAWIRRAEVANNVWRSADHALVARWQDDALSFEER